MDTVRYRSDYLLLKKQIQGDWPKILFPMGQLVISGAEKLNLPGKIIILAIPACDISYMH